MSPFSIKYWVNKGYSEEDAKYEISIRRPTNFLYWVNKGHSEEDAKIQVALFSKSGGDAAAARDIEKIKQSSKRCKEYWIKKGYSEEDAKIEVGKIQSTFSLKKCIEKYGEILGRQRWEERQNKWLDNLNSKSAEEKAEINKKKVTSLESFRLKYGDEFCEAEFELFKKSHVFTLKKLQKKNGKDKGLQLWKDYCIKKNRIWCENLEEVKSYILSSITRFDLYLPLDKLKKKYIKTYWWEHIERPKDIDSWILSFVELKNINGDIIYKRNGFYNLHLPNGSLLRSSKEITFYMLLIESGLKLDIDFEIEKTYPNSKMRSDFFFIKGRIFVEICGFGNKFSDDKSVYEQKMIFKEKTFGAKLLWNDKDYEKFIKEYNESYYRADY